MAKFTKKAIVETFIGLLEKKPLSQITVKEITELCEINHNTFYYYFSDVYSIVEEIFDEEIANLQEITFSSGTLGEACSFALEFITKNKRSINNIYCSVSCEQLIHYLERVIDKVLNDFADRGLKDVKISDEDKRLFLEYHKCAMLGGIMMWFQGNKDEELEYTLKKFSVLTENSVAELVRNAVEAFRGE